MFSVDASITDLKIKDRTLFKVLYSMNNHQIANPEMSLEEARSYIFFFKEGGKIQAYVGLYLIPTDRRMFYAHSSNPFPDSEVASVEEEARNFAEDLGAVLDELKLAGLSEEAKHAWIDQQEILGEKRKVVEAAPVAAPEPQPVAAPPEPAAPVPAAAAYQPSAPVPMAGEPSSIWPSHPAMPTASPAAQTVPVQETTPAASFEAQAPAVPVWPVAPVQQTPPPAAQPVMTPTPAPVTPQAVQPPLAPAPVQQPATFDLWPGAPQAQPAVAQPVQQAPVQYVPEPPPAIPVQPAPVQPPQAMPAPQQNQEPVTAYVPAPPVPQPPVLQPPVPEPVMEEIAVPVDVEEVKVPASQEVQPERQAPEQPDPYYEQQDAMAGPAGTVDDVLEEAVRAGVVKAPTAKLKKDLRSATGGVSREKEALARLLTSF